MSKVIEYKEYYICDICTEKVSKKILNRFKRKYMLLDNTYVDKQFDICDWCMKDIRRMMENRRKEKEDNE